MGKSLAELTEKVKITSKKYVDHPRRMGMVVNSTIVIFRKDL